jgi:hypothetical protein
MKWKVELTLGSGRVLYTESEYNNKEDTMKAIKEILEKKEGWIYDKNGYVHKEHIAAILAKPWKQTLMAAEEAQEKFADGMKQAYEKHLEHLGKGKGCGCNEGMPNYMG